MTSLRFIGDIALWQGVLLAAVVALFSWLLYWRESRVLPNVARWVLPTLRAAAIVLCLLVLTAPVLHHRYREGEPGRLRFLIDGSQSMAIADRELDQDTKLAIARSLDWSDASTESAPAASSGEAAAASVSHSAIEHFDESKRYERALERLLVADGGVLDQLRDDFEIVVERFDAQRNRLWESTLTQSTPLPRDPGAWVPREFGSVTRLGEALAAGRVSEAGQPDAAPADAAAADAAPADAAVSTSESSADAASAGSGETLVLLSDGRNTAGISPLAVAESLAAQRRPVFVIGYGGQQAPQDISLLAVEHPDRVFERDMLRGTLVVRERMKSSMPLKLAIKLAGEVVWEETRTLPAGDRGRVDFAFPVQPLVEKIRQSERSTDFTAVPLHLQATIEPHEGEADAGNNTRDFHVSVVTKRSRLLLVDGRSRWETRYLHNMFERDPAWQVDIVLPDYRQTPPKLPRGTEEDQWPSTKERLFEYDLVILGEVPAEVLPAESIDWLKNFVESSGGGLIVIDGARGNLRDPRFKPLHDMLPIEWADDSRPYSDPVAIHLTSTAKQLSAFQLTPLDPAKNEATWSGLPPLSMTTAVTALPGSEVLATTSGTDAGKDVENASSDVPLMLTRQFGAGRVFYSGTDETWRWRYKHADTYHQRFWNQVARWVMRLPMAVQGQFVSVDAGKLVYRPEETVVIRTRLRNAQGEPARNLAVEAIVTSFDGAPNDEAPSDGASENTAAEASAESGNASSGISQSASGNPSEPHVVAVVPLVADSAIAGVYSGQLRAPVGGNYRVSIVAPGLTSEALAVHTEFSVVEPDSGEMDQLSCDESLLRKLAEVTGGQYLSEQQGDELASLLQPLSRGKIIESDTLIWQSYWWFVPIVLLLSVEWWLRKRVGLI